MTDRTVYPETDPASRRYCGAVVQRRFTVWRPPGLPWNMLARATAARAHVPHLFVAWAQGIGWSGSRLHLYVDCAHLTHSMVVEITDFGFPVGATCLRCTDRALRERVTP